MSFRFGVLLVAVLSALPAAAEPPANLPYVARAIVTTNIKDLEPVDNRSHFPEAVDRVNFFTDVRNMNGKTIAHRWEYQERVMLETRFNISSDRYRVYSTKTMTKLWPGAWRAVVADSEGNTLAAVTFT